MTMRALLQRFCGRARLLAHALLTGGVNHAQKVLNKLRGADLHSLLTPFLQTLCQDEASLDEDTHALTTKPLVCQFSSAFKRDLLCFLHLVHPGLPRDHVLALLRCLMQETVQNPWVSSLITQLRKDTGDEDFRKDTLLTPECISSLRGLCERFKGSQEKGGWDLYLNEQTTGELCTGSQTDLVHKKRKSEITDLHAEEDVDEPQIKRRKVDLTAQEDSEGEEVPEYQDESDVKTLQLDKETEGDYQATHEQVAHEGYFSVLPDHIKAAVPLIKELLESGTEWGESCITLKVLHECDSNQLEALCTMLHLSEAPEQSLPHFCSGLLALSPDLSHSTASVIIKNLLLGKVLSLIEPASRCLVTAVTSLCTRYPRPTCQALIEPVIKKGQTGSPQAELICRMVKDSLEPQYKLLVFQMTLVESWNEGLLSVIHDLLDSKIELSEEVFLLFTNQLSSQSSQFTKSMKFSKMMLTVLTKFQSHVNAACQHTLSCCISCNETFLKKSLQAALKRTSH